MCTHDRDSLGSIESKMVAKVVEQLVGCEGGGREIPINIWTILGAESWVAAAAGTNRLAVLATSLEVFRKDNVTLRNVGGNEYGIRPNVSTRQSKFLVLKVSRNRPQRLDGGLKSEVGGVGKVQASITTTRKAVWETIVKAQTKVTGCNVSIAGDGVTDS
jgi:hypothetical protein